MKKIIISVFTFWLFLTFNSCSDDYFEKIPLGEMSENTFYTEKGIDALLVGAYAQISGVGETHDGRGASIQHGVLGSMSSDDAYKGNEESDGSFMNPIERWEVPTDNRMTHEFWRVWYGTNVVRANTIIEVANKIEDQGIISATKATQVRAEAHFLRGLAYFELWLQFQNIPIITEETEDPAQVSNVNPEGAVLEQIISDLKFARENLPENQSDPGRPTKYAAMGLAARAYLHHLRYADAKPLLDNIIESGKYELMPNFYDNYRIEHNNNKESIFEIQASVNDGSTGRNGGMGTAIFIPHGGDIGLCCGQHQMSQNLVNAYRVDENGLPEFEKVNIRLKNDYGLSSKDEFIPYEGPVDPRLDWTVGRRGIPYLDWGIMRGQDWIRDQINGGPYLPPKKRMYYQKHKGTLTNTENWQRGISAKNFPYIRLGHVLLWRAEVAAFEGDLETARKYVNMIRDRADNEHVMGQVNIYKLPGSVYPWGEEGDVDWDQPAANYKIGLYDSFADRAEAMRAVQWELRLEFASEGNRFYDLRRWDNLPADLNSVPMKNTLDEYAENDPRPFMIGYTFSERAKIYPIPQQEIDLQPGVLVQNPGY
jgi:starch-binding outer membrane protein, SusD/RagB family